MVDNKLHARAIERVSSAQAAVDQVLETGTDTTQVRADLHAARAELTAVESESAQQMETEVTVLVQTARAKPETLDGLAILPALPEPTLPVGIAVRLVRARHQAADHAARVSAHQARLSGLCARLSALQTGRQRLWVAARRAAWTMPRAADCAESMPIWKI